MTKYQMVQCMATVFQMDMNMVVAEKCPSSSGAKRPYDTTMSRERVLTALGPTENLLHTEFKVGIAKCLKKWMM